MNNNRSPVLNTEAECLIIDKTLVRQVVNTPHIVIPEGVEILGPGALKADYTTRGMLETLTLPSTLKQIGESAVAGHINLTDIRLPEGLEVIENSAFGRCETLKTVTIPSSVRFVGHFAFSDCKELEKVELLGVFSGKKERTLWATESEGTLSAGLFSGCVSLKEVTIPQGFTVIGDSAFKGTSLQAVTIPDSVTEICSNAFDECFLLKSIHLPRNLANLGNKVFPTSTIGWGARASVLDEVAVDPENRNFRSESGILCSAHGEVVFCPERQGAADFTIPHYITAVHGKAFLGNNVIRRLTIPETVSHLDERAFSEMRALEEVVFTGKREHLPKELFFRCRKLKQITWPDDLKTIGDSCFEESGLDQVHIPDSVEDIGSYAFACTKIKSVTLPKTVKKIGLSIFAMAKDITVYDSLHPEAKPAAEGVDEINGRFNSVVGFLGIYQRKGTLIGACNSHWYQHTITVRSAETGEIKYAVRMPYDQKRKVCCTFASAWGKNAGFHFPAIDALFKDLTADAKQDYALARMEQWDSLSEEMKDTLSKYITRNARELSAQVMERDDPRLLSLMESCGIVKKNTLDQRLEQAEKAGAMSCKAWLLEWQHKNISPKEKAKKAENALKMRAPTVAEIKKLWPHKKGADGGLIITGYNGTDPDAVVPEIIGRTPVTGIAPCAFSESKDPQQQIFLREVLRSVVIPDSVTTIGYMAFYNCAALESVRLPRDLEILEGSLFYGCAKLVVSIPEKVCAIKGTALVGVANELLEIPRNVSSVAPDAFVPSGMRMRHTAGLKEFRVAPESTAFKSVEGVLCSADGATLVSYPGGKDGETYAVPQGVAVIAENAFRHNQKLKHIVLPDTVNRIDACAFASCAALETIVMPKKLQEMGSSVFSECAVLREVTVPGGIATLPGYTFHMCSGLKTVALPRTMTRIDDYAFHQCALLETVEIPAGLKGVGKQAFRRCGALKSLRFSDQTTNIGYAAFQECYELTLHAPEGSKVYAYAKNNRIRVVSDPRR